MATITLRAYIREIEALIDHGQTENAIAHCMHILQYMPKHIGTYRMLGKALHEAQRYADAADVFQRVLSVVPDDFVSHVGLSIIRQDEGNMDAAIWHMERAFETQPSNQPIQEELRRLYGRRDGLEPPRARLTRGALSRMYIKGHLYSQAVGELRAALSEDPHRTDLQVLLAQATYLNGQKVEAVEVCSQLLQKYPYCLEANRHLALILPGTERAKDAEIYRQRLFALDPYLKKSEPDLLVSETVPDAAITVEKLEIIPGQEPPGRSQPDWAASLGASFLAEETSELPEWLSQEEQRGGKATADQATPLRNLDQEDSITRETSTDKLGTDWLKSYETEIEASPDSQISSEDSPIPDWMRAAGWEPSAGGIQDAPISWEEFEATNEGEIEEGEIPDWLKAIAPDAAEADETSPSPWLENKSPGASDTVVNWLNQNKEAASEEDLSDLETALDQAISEKSQEQVEGVAEIPEWLRGLEDQGPSEGPTTGELHIPEWLKEEEPELPAAEVSPGEGLEWLKEVAVEPALEEPSEPSGEPVDALSEGEIPEWLKSLQAETSVDSEKLVAPSEFASELPADAGVEAPEEQNLVPEPASEGEGVEGLVEEETIIATPAEAEAVEETSEEAVIIEPPVTEKVEETWADQTIIAAPAEAEAGEEVLEEAVITEPTAAEEVEEIWANQTIIAAPAEAEAVEETSEEVAITEPAAAEQVEDIRADQTIIASPAEAKAVEETSEEVVITEPSEAEPAEDSFEDTFIMKRSAKVTEELVETEAEQEIPAWLQEMVEETSETALADASGEKAWIEETEAREETQITKTPEAEPLIAMDTSAAETGLMDEDDALALLASLAEKHAGENGWLESVVAETMGEDASVEVEKQPGVISQPDEPVIAAPEPTIEDVEEHIEIEGEVETIAWLETLAESQEADEQPKVIDEPSSEPVTAEHTEDVVPVSSPEEDTTIDIPGDEAIPDWLRALGEEENAEVETIAGSEAATPSDTIIAKIDINAASLAELEDLPGIGFILAQNILNYRQMHGPFEQVESLAEVPGMTPVDIETLRAFIKIDTEEPSPGVVTRLFGEPRNDIETALSPAREFVTENKLEDAALQYNSLIQQGDYLPEIIQDLQDFLALDPQNLIFWQSLGDAYMRNDQLQEALEAYTHAEELLR